MPADCVPVIPAKKVATKKLPRLPERPADFTDYLETGGGMAPLLRRIRDCFAAGEACSAKLPCITSTNAFSATALENSVAGRQAGKPVLQAIEANTGRGPLWRATARVYDAQDCIEGLLPPAEQPQQGKAVVPAARGTYAVEAEQKAGIVTAFRRITPTDHLVAQGGILDQTLATLPRKKNGMAPLLMDILDPCMPVTLKEVRDA